MEESKEREGRKKERGSSRDENEREGQRLDEREKLTGHNNFAPDCFLSFSLWISLPMYSQL